MPYMQVFTVKYCFVYVGFSLADSFFEFLATGNKGSYGGRKRAARTMKIAALYLLLLEQAEATVAVQHIAHFTAGQVPAFHQYGTMIAVCQFASRLLHVLYISDRVRKE